MSETQENAEAPKEDTEALKDAGPERTPDEIERALEATLFASEEPMSVDELAKHLGGLSNKDARDGLRALVEHYSTRGVRLVERGKRWMFQTAPDQAHLLRREKEQVRRLSRAGTEVLAIIAYHEPVSRAEIESIRGVQTAKGTLDVLLEAGWIKLAGRREVPGRPVIYATTPEFLDHFGLGSRRDLPGIDELRAAGLLDPVDEALEDALEVLRRNAWTRVLHDQPYHFRGGLTAYPDLAPFGRVLDRVLDEVDHDLLDRIPESVDPCGENGEFHTFAYDGPDFASRIPVTRGEVVERGGFVFADLLPASD